MKNKNRDIYMSFRVTQDEKKFIKEKAMLLGKISTGAYIREMAISGISLK